MPVHAAIAQLFSELVNGPTDHGGAFVLNSGDIGLLRSLDGLAASAASSSTHGGATIAAHAQHVRYGLSLMNEWFIHGGNPFADARWDEAWTISEVDDAMWKEIRSGLSAEAGRWLDALKTPRDVTDVEHTGMISSVAHVAYHLGAIRQIHKDTRGPREGTFDDSVHQRHSGA
jgi:hypothetical protein